MNDILSVMKFTIKDMLKRKSYIISTIIILILIVVGFNIPNIISKFNNSDTNNDMKIAIIDQNNIFEDKLILLNDFNLNYDLNFDINENDIEKELENENIDSAIIISKDNYQVNMKYLVNDMSLVYSTPDDLINSISDLYRTINLNKLELTEEQIASINPSFNIQIESLGDNSGFNTIITVITSIILFYAIYFCAYQVSGAITVEKTSKVMETLVVSTSPTNIVLGKTIGIGIVGFGQMLLIILTAFISANCFLEKELLNMILDTSNITFSFGIITIIYFVLGYLLFAFLYALTGSTASKPEDIQSVNTPVALLAVFGFYFSYFSSINPDNKINYFASLIPFSSPFCMPLRVMMGLASSVDIIISIFILIITILIIAKIAIKIYSSAILNYGTKLSLKDLIQLYKNK